jgi:hypothetical protein|nr:MAG TPA: hypothetical protein [Caudoviricetes sp.]
MAKKINLTNTLKDRVVDYVKNAIEKLYIGLSGKRLDSLKVDFGTVKVDNTLIASFDIKDNKILFNIEKTKLPDSQISTSNILPNWFNEKAVPLVTATGVNSNALTAIYSIKDGKINTDFSFPIYRRDKTYFIGDSILDYGVDSNVSEGVATDISSYQNFYKDKIVPQFGTIEEILRRIFATEFNISSFILSLSLSSSPGALKDGFAYAYGNIADQLKEYEDYLMAMGVNIFPLINGLSVSPVEATISQVYLSLVESFDNLFNNLNDLSASTYASGNFIAFSLISDIIKLRSFTYRRVLSIGKELGIKVEDAKVKNVDFLLSSLHDSENVVKRNINGKETSALEFDNSESASEFLEKNEGYEQVDEENGKVYLSLKGQK